MRLLWFLLALAAEIVLVWFLIVFWPITLVCLVYRSLGQPSRP